MLKRLKKLHPDGRNGYLPPDCTPDKLDRLVPPAAARSSETQILTQKHRSSGGVATLSTKFRPPAEIIQTKEDVIKMKSREQMGGRDNDIGKTVKELPSTDIGPKRLKVRGPSLFTDEQALGSTWQMPEDDRRTDSGFTPGASSRS